jgi:hypothetical protein
MRNEKILRPLVGGFIILALCLPGFSEDKIVTSHWAAAPLKIDGQDSDWDTQALNSEKKVGVDYAFGNDAETLYIMAVFRDPKFLSSISLTGMTIWFNPETHKKKDVGIRFIAKAISADQYIAMLEEKAGAVPEAQKAQIRTNQRYMFYDHELIDKTSKATPAKFIETAEFKIPVFRNAAQEKTVVFEFLIPLQRLAELSPAIGADPGRTIQVCFEWGGATQGLKEAVAAQIGSEGARSRSEAATGELTEERDFADSGGEGLAAMRRRLPKQYSFWAKVKLAQGQ